MSRKTFIPTGETPPASQIGATLEALAATIAARRGAGEESYTHRLLAGAPDAVLKKVMEEAGEVALAAKDVEALPCAPDAPSAERDAAIDHLRYEAADVLYHVLVVLERYDIPLEELAAELNARMTADERPAGGTRLCEGHVRRGK